VTVTSSLTRVMPPGAVGADRESGAWAWLGAVPEAVVRPRSTAEVASVLSWASAQGMSVVPVGSGRHALADRVDAPFVVLSTERMTGIQAYEPADLTFTARAGTTLRELDGVLAAHAQWIPVDPPRRPERTLGGLAAAGLSGPLWMGYGEIRNHVLGMTLVRGDGQVLRLGGGVVKNVAGFDLLKPVVGSRGTLGVVTSVCMRTFPVPATDRVLALRAERPSALVPAARAVCTAPVLPVSVVLLAPAPPRGAGAALVVRLHGAADTVAADQASLEEHAGVSFDRVEPTRADALLAAVRDHGARAPVVLRMSVLPSRLSEALAAIEALGGPGGESTPLVHVDAYAGRVRVGLPAKGTDVAGIAASLRATAETLGGALGVERRPAGLPLDGAATAPSDDERALGLGLRRVFDPEGVLWHRHR
jgi:FAD/FMN-containing dehydrogenase